MNLCLAEQGNLIGRGVVEFCDGAPPVRTYLRSFLTLLLSQISPHCSCLCLKVKNFISLAGPHAGIASVPLCGVSSKF